MENTAFILLGALLASSLVFWARDRDHAKTIYLFCAVSLPMIYLFFTVSSGVNTALLPEFIYGLPYFFAPIFLLIKSEKICLLITAALWFSHGFYDAFHHLLFDTAHVPYWYIMTCIGFDLFIGIYLLLAVYTPVGRRLQFN